MTVPNSTPSTTPINADIIIVGGGFGGCFALHQLRNAGYSVKLLEAGSDFGGVWHHNRYPGARVDSDMPLYQLSLPKAWGSFNFSERFAGHKEIRQYFSHIAEALDLRKDAIFNTRVVKSSFDSKSSTWSLIAENGLTTKSRYVVFATGSTNKAYIPSFPGLDTFTGKVIHPVAWPKDVDLSGKRIGIIGQGASGLQILQELAKDDYQITVFVRNPPNCFPMKQRSLSRVESEQQKVFYEALFQHAKYHHEQATAHGSLPGSFHDASPEERRQRYEEVWARGSYAIFAMTYPEVNFDKAANADLYQFWAEKVRSRITDPVKRDIMAPVEQFQWIGMKRPSLETNYYEMIDRPNVKLVDLKKSPIKKFTGSGIVTGQDVEEAHDLDVVIFATGYDSVTGSLYGMNISDKHGQPLQKKWEDGICTYLGMMIPETPNAFLLYGPQAPSGLANGPPFLELQVEWIAEVLQKLRAEKILSIEASTEAADAYSQKHLQIYDQSLMKETPSWWNGSNIPGKKREPLFWVGGLQGWRALTLEGLKGWSNYVLKRQE
ncbi:steroid monooxygenase [Fusarium beomiforme]|uniref:Steroid monooxygenase n=1 Tax=Fusarium beomiforme TaxID=44412 RepID=A0A9P5DXL7_9HYPO|nr:steroid monooxygenase [Fusarium beomiforme]